MAAFTNPTRLGSINAGLATRADELETFLKLWAGEVLLQFEIENVMMSRTFVKTVMTGKSVQWPRTNRVTASYHTPGAELDPAIVHQSEIVATIDELLTAEVFIDKLDEAMNHWDARSAYTTEMGRKLANQMDDHIIIEGIIGAQLTAVGDELPTGTPVNGATTGATAFRSSDGFVTASEITGGSPAADIETAVSNIVDALFDAAARFDNNKVPKAGRYAIFKPREYRRLSQAVQTNGFSAVNRDYGGTGSIAQGVVLQLAGFDLLESTALQDRWDQTGAAGIDTYHSVDTRQSLALLGVNNAIGTGKMLDIAIENEYSARHQGTLFVASYAVTHKYLRPEGLLELTLATNLDN